LSAGVETTNTGAPSFAANYLKHITSSIIMHQAALVGQTRRSPSPGQRNKSRLPICVGSLYYRPRNKNHFAVSDLTGCRGHFACKHNLRHHSSNGITPEFTGRSVSLLDGSSAAAASKLMLGYSLCDDTPGECLAKQPRDPIPRKHFATIVSPGIDA
jgi:hypothetical protein